MPEADIGTLVQKLGHPHTLLQNLNRLKVSASLTMSILAINHFSLNSSGRAETMLCGE